MHMLDWSAYRGQLVAAVGNLAKLSPDKSLYLTTGGTPWIYLLYFSGRSAWNAELSSAETVVVESCPLAKPWPSLPL